MEEIQIEKALVLGVYWLQLNNQSSVIRNVHWIMRVFASYPGAEHCGTIS